MLKSEEIVGCHRAGRGAEACSVVQFHAHLDEILRFYELS